MGTRPGRWRRLAIRLAACGGVGALATVGVAWVIALRVFPEGGQVRSQPGKAWPHAADSGWPPGPDLLEYERNWARRTTVWSASSMDNTWIITKHDTGVPVPSMRATVEGSYSGLGGLTLPWTASGKKADGLTAPPWCGGPSGAYLPVTPLFGGFALDTAFYAAIAFVLWSAPAAIRRHRRRARGRCPACGYDRKGAPTVTCPECGE